MTDWVLRVAAMAVVVNDEGKILILREDKVIERYLELQKS